MLKKHTPRVEFSISGSVLKHIAYVSMFIDHFFAVVFIACVQWINAQGISLETADRVYRWGRAVGRIAFILFAFMAAEGFVHTHNRKKYLLRLGVFALISEIPFDLAFQGTVFTMEGQNVYFTLFFGVMALYLMWKLQGHLFLQFNIVALCCIMAILLDTDYMFMGVLLIVVFYLCRKSFWYQFIAGSLTIYFGIVAVYAIGNWDGLSMLPIYLKWGMNELYGLFAFILIYFYHGEKGKQLPKICYYAFYPLHLLLLYGVKELMLGI